MILRAVVPILLFAGCNIGWQDYKPGNHEELVYLPKTRVDFTPEVQKYLRHYLTKDVRYIEVSEKNSKNFIKEIQEIFDAYKIPRSLINIAAIESKFDPKVRSSFGAVGIWQIMRITAKHYGLKASLLNDRRKDPIESTKTICTMLRDLYSQFHDWNLVLAAYNSGQTRVRNAIKKAGTDDVWYLLRNNYLPNQTHAFVAKVNALILIEKYGLTPDRAISERKFANIVNRIKYDA